MGCLFAVVWQDHTRQTVDETLVLPFGGCKGSTTTLSYTVELMSVAASSARMDTPFQPTRAAALERLAKFAPQAGRTYAARRNFDLGPGKHDAVSQLSPYLRCRLITEEDVVRSVLAYHSPADAEKFIQEVFWRTYWKGWLEMRPEVWTQYLSALDQHWNDVQTQSGLRARWEAACLGETEIECFNAWSQEIVTTGYMHNHARMWFASIWIFTLKLPWELGADFFLRHLFDGDPASNTLGWRWVAGIQTPGKTYLARTSNISKFTEGRFHPKWQLATEAPALSGPVVPAPRPLAATPSIDPTLRTGFLLHEDDLSPGFVRSGAPIHASAVLAPQTNIGPLYPAPGVTEFRKAALEDCVSRYPELLAKPAWLGDAEAIQKWAVSEQLEQIVTPYAPVGPVADQLSRLENAPEAPFVCKVMRALDQRAWPHATKGFFPFKKNIPDLITHILNTPAEAG